MFWEIFERLCAQRGSNPTALSTEMGFSNATATKWKKGSLPQAAALLTIGEFFDVSIDYLLGRTDVPEVNRGEPTHLIKMAARAGGGIREVALTESQIEALKNLPEVPNLDDKKDKK